jgi:transcriptional regulator with XRE-family HTH domain
MPTFGKIIAEARKRKGLSQKELASRIIKESGDPISPQYLNDIEHDRRNPPSEFLISRFATELGLAEDYLCLAAGSLPAQEMRKVAAANPKEVTAAFKAFRKKISGR